MTARSVAWVLIPFISLSRPQLNPVKLAYDPPYLKAQRLKQLGQYASQGFYPDALGLRGITSIGGADDGDLGAVPQRGSGAEPLVRGLGGFDPKKLETFCCVSS